MKKIVFLIITFFFALTLSAQTSSQDTIQWRLVGVGKATRDGKHVEEKVDEKKIEEKKVEEKPVAATEDKKAEEKPAPKKEDKKADEKPAAATSSKEVNNDEAEAIDEDDDQPAKSKFRIKNRRFELGLANATLGISNNFLSLDEIFTEVIIIDMEKLENGLKFDMSADVLPLYLFINNKDCWGFGLDVGHITVFGNMDISGNLLRFKKTDGDKFGVGASAFVDVGIPMFFQVNKLKIKLRPAGYVPALYLEPNMKYTYKDTDKGSSVALDYDLQLYTIVPIDPENDSMQPEYSIGYDLSAGLEYKLSNWFDLGVDVKNIPIVPGSLSHYMKMKGSVAVDTSNLSFGDDDESDELMNNEISDPVYGKEKKDIRRPFKTVVYANYRPFGTETVTIIPRAGFAINPLYEEPLSIEAGGYIRFDLANLFITTIGVNYEDRTWKNSAAIALNFKFIEIDLGVSLQSPDFVKSWKGAGVCASVGLKLGW